MTVEVPDTTEPEPEPPARPEVTLGEVCAVVGILLVAAIATWSLALAQLGRHDGLVAVGLGLATVAVIAGAALAVEGRPRVRFDRAELALVVGVAAAAAFFFLPGFHYAWNDKDPGVYVVHGFAIARDGDAYIDDDVRQAGITPATDPAGRFPGLWYDARHPGTVTGQFYHQYSALLATAEDLGGARALFTVNPLLAIGAVCSVVVAARRTVGTLVAGLTGALLVTSMMQVWQAKYPSSEIPAQFFLAGTLLAGILAVRQRWAGAGFAAGLLLGVGFLARPDGFLYVFIGAAVAGLAIAADRADRRIVAFLAGLAITLPYALWNAAEARPEYSASTDVPATSRIVVPVVACLVGGLIVRAVVRAGRRRWPDASWLDARAVIDRWSRPVGVVLALGFGIAVALLFLSPDIWGEQYHYNILTKRVQRSYNELSGHWFSWFITVRGLLLMVFGFLVVMLRRWRASTWLLVVPGATLLIVYLYNARVTMRLMWWVRRFIPAVLPAVIILIAIGLAWLLTRRSNIVKVVGAVLAVSLVVEYARTSLPLRNHDEMGGSWDLSADVAAAAGGEQGVFLFPGGSTIYSINRNAPGAVWLLFDQIAARLPADYDIATVDEYRDAFPDQPVFVVAEGAELPEQLPDDQFRRARTVSGDLHVWEERLDRRPSEEIVMPLGVTVWELVG